MSYTKVQQELEKFSTPWLEERTIILAPTGSYAYGTNTENSDKDYKGVCIPPKEYFLGLDAFNEFNTSGGKNFKNTKDDVDINIIHINKFVQDALKGVPNNIEMLFVRPEDYLKVTEYGQVLIDNRHLFLSKSMYNKFRGYAQSQKQRMMVKNSNGAGRQDLIQAFGYDTKFFMHTIRLQTSAIEIFETGDFSTFRPNREFLLDCRNGLYSLEQALDMVEEHDKKLEEVYEKSTILPEKPDYQKINQMLMEINQKALNL